MVPVLVCACVGYGFVGGWVSFALGVCGLDCCN